MCVNGKSSTEAVGGWTVELDGPLLFLACRLPVGGTLMTRRQLELLVYNTVVTLPFWNDGDRRKEGVSKGKTAHFMIVWVFGSGTQKNNMSFVTPPGGFSVSVTAPSKSVSFVSATFEDEDSSGDKKTCRQLKFGEEAVQKSSVKMVKTKSREKYDHDDDVPLAVLSAKKKKSGSGKGVQGKVKAKITKKSLC
jgi:hypothetical protein